MYSKGDPSIVQQCLIHMHYGSDYMNIVPEILPVRALRFLDDKALEILYLCSLLPWINFETLYYFTRLFNLTVKEGSLEKITANPDYLQTLPDESTESFKYNLRRLSAFKFVGIYNNRVYFTNQTVKEALFSNIIEIFPDFLHYVGQFISYLYTKNLFSSFPIEIVDYTLKCMSKEQYVADMYFSQITYFLTGADYDMIHKITVVLVKYGMDSEFFLAYKEILDSLRYLHTSR